MNKNLLGNILSALFVLAGFALLFIQLFVETQREIPFWVTPVLIAFGILIGFRRKQVLDTLGKAFSLFINRKAK